jgi:enamine deaminase RidA (YjgF/YER057c/UK114 family)
VNGIKRREHNGHTEVVEHNGVLYLGGIATSDPSLPLAGQTREALAEVDRVLNDAGSSKASILQARVNLTNYDDKDEMNAIWREWLDGMALPARTVNGVVALGKGVLIEVVIIAAKE